MFSNIPKNNNIRKRTYPKNTKSKNIIKNLMKLLSLIFLKWLLNAMEPSKRKLNDIQINVLILKTNICEFWFWVRTIRSINKKINENHNGVVKSIKLIFSTGLIINLFKINFEKIKFKLNVKKKIKELIDGNIIITILIILSNSLFFCSP